MAETGGGTPIYLTVEGRGRLERRLAGYEEQLSLLRSPPTGEARDRADQAERLDAQDDISRLEDLISDLRDVLAAAQPLPAAPDDGVARQGSVVTVRDESGSERHFQLLDGAELEDDSMHAAIDSPLGRAIAGRGAGAVVSVAAPAGERRLTIVAVEPYRAGR